MKLAKMIGIALLLSGCAEGPRSGVFSPERDTSAESISRLAHTASSTPF